MVEHKATNLAKLKGKPRDNFLPVELRQEYGRLLTSRTHGVNASMRVRTILKSKHPVEGMT